MKNKTQKVLFIAIFVLSAVIGYFGVGFLLTPSKPKVACKPIEKPVPEMAVKNVLDSSATPEKDSVSKPLFVYDSSALLRSFNPWMIFSENFNASYRDSVFSGSYQLVYPIKFPCDTLADSKFDRLLLSQLFGVNAPKVVNRKSIQTALDKMMKGDLKNTHEWWNDAKARYGKRWRDEVCGCSGYFYAMPTEKTSRWISFQQISDYQCGGNGGPGEKYYTIIAVGEPYIMDTTVFVPGFREKLIDMITDNVIYNFYGYETGRRIGRGEIRKATADMLNGNFQPSLTLSGVKFLYSTWALPLTCHADGRIPVIVPYRMIQEIFTEKFKKDIGL